MNYQLLSKMYYKNKELYANTFEERFYNESTLRFDLKISENKAFLICNFELLNQVSQIRKLDKQLDTLANMLPGIALNQFTTRCLIDEISLTNEIEGVRSTRKEINDIIIDKSISISNKRLYGLVKKYQLLSNEKLQIKTCEDVRNIYNELVLEEIRSENPDNVPDGLYFRQSGVNVQNQHFKSIHKGIMPEKAIIEYMNEALKILQDDSMDILIRIAIFHYLFGYIHPFYDGNGRTSRFISSYLLSKELHPLVSYSLSYNIKKKINSYYNAFKYSNDPKNKGDLTPFVLIFLDILRDAIKNLCETLSDKIDALDNLRGQLFSKVSSKAGELLFIILQNTLFGENGLSVYELHDITKISIATIRPILRENKDLLTVNKDSNTKLYQIDLEKLV